MNFTRDPEGKYTLGDKRTRKTGKNETETSKVLMRMSFKIIKVLFSCALTEARKNPKTFVVSLSSAVITYIMCSGMTSSPKSAGEIAFPHATRLTYSAWQDCERDYKCTSPSVQNGDLEFELHEVDMPDVFLKQDTGSIMIHSESCGSIQVKVKSKRDTNVMLLTVKHEVPKCIPAALAAMQQNQVTTSSTVLTVVAAAVTTRCMELAMAAAYAAFTSG